jgi:hypothetical protein
VEGLSLWLFISFGVAPALGGAVGLLMYHLTHRK